MTDWRLPENRREAFQRFYTFHLKYRSHPGCVYALLPAIAEAYDLDDDGRAWLAWLNGNTQNVVTSLLLLEAAPTHHDWAKAVAFWADNFKALEWDTDRRHQKSKFGEATEEWYFSNGDDPAVGWHLAGELGWKATWAHAKAMPYFGRLSAWSGLEYARILLGDVVPDIGEWMLEDKSGSQSHRNGVALVAGYDSVYWDAGDPDLLGIVGDLTAFADELLDEARRRNRINETCPSCEGQGCESCRGIGVWDGGWHPDVGRLTMESALCTYKSWHKPNRRYPNVYADMMYNRIKRGEERFGAGRFDLLWGARRDHLPEALRLEDNPKDPGLSPVKQNHYLNTGEIPMMYIDWPDMISDFDRTFGTPS